MNRHATHVRNILAEIEADDGISQRRLAIRVGIALGLTNLILRRIIAKGWIRTVHGQGRRVRYVLTASGVAAKTRLTQRYLRSTLQFYATARQRVRERFVTLSQELEARQSGKRILFFGADDIAEIGYVSLQDTDLQLTGVIDSRRTKPFFGLPVYPPASLRELAKRRTFDRVVVMALESHRMRRALLEQGLSADQIFWMWPFAMPSEILTLDD